MRRGRWNHNNRPPGPITEALLPKDITTYEANGYKLLLQWDGVTYCNGKVRPGALVFFESGKYVGRIVIWHGRLKVSVHVDEDYFYDKQFGEVEDIGRALPFMCEVLKKEHVRTHLLEWEQPSKSFKGTPVKEGKR